MFKKVGLFLFASLCVSNFSNAQNLHNQSADKIIGTIGSKYIVMSDLDNFFAQKKQANDTIGADAKCDFLFEFVTQKILCEQAYRDSMVVSELEVETELNDRVQQYITRFGSKEQMEARLGRSIYQIKEDYREEIREQLTANQMQGMLTSDVVVTPNEVKAVFNEIGTMPYINATVEIGQIIFNPKSSQEVEDYTKNKLEDIRQQIVTGGRDFATMAGIESEDPGSRDEGGFLTAEKDQLDPIFASAAFRLKDGETSPVFRSAFGYHIIYMVKRYGNSKADLRHILLVPAVTSIDIQTSKDLLDSVKIELEANRMSYAQAVTKFSNDDIAKGRSGMMFDYSTGNTQLSLDQLDPMTTSMIQDLKVGEYSIPHVFENPYKRGAKAVRILFLKNRVDPHTASLETDYTLFQNFAKRKKQQEILKKEVYEYAKTMYIKLDPAYSSCEQLQPFYQQLNAGK